MAAYEQGYAEGGHQGRELGRRDLREMEAQLLAAVDRCLAGMDAASSAMAARVLDVSELYVTTALRHIPDARTAGMLVRLGEVLQSFEPGALEVSAAPELVNELSEMLAPRNKHGMRVRVVADPDLLPGEFRLHSDWADADGTFQRYLDVARQALELHLSGGER
jgi:flagellar biosynthesis/type III secretory pathway protein FliH